MAQPHTITDGNHPVPQNELAGYALSAYNQKTAEKLAVFLHACAGYPVPSE